MRLMLMGTPDFAVPCLKAVLDAGHTVAAVVTQPDKPKGRKLLLTPPPVKVSALSYGIPVYQPETLRDQSILPILLEHRPDLIAVIAYGKMLPAYILDFPKFGCVNIHASLLPRHRGAGPIQRALIEGDSETGVTSMYMAKGMDTGDMLLKEKTPITEDDTWETLHDRLSALGAALLCQTIAALEAGTVLPLKQDDALATYAPMLSKADGKLEFSKPMEELFHRYQGVTPWPGAYAYLGGKQVKLFSLQKGGTSPLQPGLAVLQGDDLAIACGDGQALLVSQLQVEGGKRMSVADFLRGHAFGDSLTFH